MVLHAAHLGDGPARGIRKFGPGDIDTTPFIGPGTGDPVLCVRLQGTPESRSLQDRIRLVPAVRFSFYRPPGSGSALVCLIRGQQLARRDAFYSDSLFFSTSRK